MNVTIAICTWNRAKLLDQTLTEMRKLAIPSGIEWEVLVVNNNCTDDTDAVIARHEDALPIRRLFEPTPGQTNARNCAVRQASGDVILWTDDDVLVDPAWVGAYCWAVSAYPEAGLFGGPILPWFEGGGPLWLRRHWRVAASAFAVRELGPAPRRFNPTELPYGANFAVRADIQRRYPFDPELGLRPGSNMRGDETAIMLQMLSDGHTGWWVPEAKVQHFVPKSRQTARYIWDYSYGSGEGQSLVGEPAEGVQWFGRPRWLWRQLITAAVRYYVRRPWVPASTWLRDLTAYATAKGRFSAVRHVLPPGTRQ